MSLKLFELALVDGQKFVYLFQLKLYVSASALFVAKLLLKRINFKPQFFLSPSEPFKLSFRLNLHLSYLTLYLLNLLARYRARTSLNMGYFFLISVQAALELELESFS
jgi:hypothetical protein